jgi:hypothetical protein
MKKILLILLTCLSFPLTAQDSKALYGKLNYSFVPHNMIQGVGYSLGYHLNADKAISYKVEMGMMTSYRERKMNDIFGDIQYLDLYYNLAQMNLAFIPTWRFLKTNQWELSAGLGLSAAYQSKIFTILNYAYRNSPTSDVWYQVNKVDASAGLRAGLLGALDVHYQLSPKWVLGLSAQYQVYYQGEAVISTGFGMGYRF